MANDFSGGIKMKRLLSIVLGIVVFVVFIGISHADVTLDNTVAVDLDWIRTELGTYNDCGVGMLDELFAYYDINGLPNLVDGEPDGLYPENSDYILDLHSYLFDHSGFINYVRPNTLSYYIEQYFNNHGINVEVERDTYPYWSDMVAELDAGRPVPLLAWGANHYVLIVGYKSNPNRVTVLWGHIPLTREYTQQELLSWWPLEMWWVRPDMEEPPPIADPSLEYWYNDVMQWCNENGWELEVVD